MLPSSRAAPRRFDLSFEEAGPAGLGPFKAHGTLSGLTSLVAFEHPLLSADVSIPALQVEGLKPFLADTAVIQRLSGQVGLTVRYTWDLGGRHTFDGMLDLDQAAYADPSLWDAPLPGTATTVAFRMSLDPGRLTFEQASVKRGPLSVAAHGTLDNLGGAVVIRDAEGTLESPVKDLLAAIPWNAFGPSGPRLREEVRSAERILPDGVKGLALSALISGFPGEPRVEGTVRGPLRVDSAASEEGAGRARRAGWEEVRGAADLDLRFSFPLRRTKEIRVDGRVALRAFAGKPLALPIRLENLEADAEVTLDSAGVSRFSTTVVLPPAVAGAGDRFTLSLAGRVDALSKQAALTLFHLETSPIPLPSASSLVPRESTGAAATAVREILEAGGTLAVEELAFPRTELTRLSRDPASLLPTSKAAVSFSGIVFKPVPGLPAVEDVAGRASLQGGVVTATGVHGRAGALTLPDITIRLAGLESRPRSAFWAKGPLRVTEARNESGRELLRRHGLASLTGSVDVDLHAERDWATAVGWVGGGSLQLSGVRAVTFPAGVVVDKLEGRVTIDRRAALDVVAERLTATVDGAPVRLSGTLRGAGSAGVAVEATAFAKGLDLSRARELFPSVKPLGLEGRLDMDVKVSLPAAGTGEPRLSGGVSTRNAGLRIPGAGLAVTGGDIDVTLSGNAAEILRMSLQLNGQALTATGRIQIPAEPDLRSGGPPASSGPPTLLRRLKASVSVQAAQGRFRGVGFHDLTLGAAFDRGVLTSCDLALGVGSGRIAATGTADLRLPGEVSFVLRPEVTALATESVSPGVRHLPFAYDRAPLAFGRASGTGRRSVELPPRPRGEPAAEDGPRQAHQGRPARSPVRQDPRRGERPTASLRRIPGELLPGGARLHVDDRGRRDRRRKPGHEGLLPGERRSEARRARTDRHGPEEPRPEDQARGARRRGQGPGLRSDPRSRGAVGDLDPSRRQGILRRSESPARRRPGVRIELTAGGSGPGDDQALPPASRRRLLV